VPNKNQIRFGLSAVKNVGSGIVETIVEERKTNGPYVSIEDFIARISSKDLNKKSMESLVKAGAFDKIAERNQLLLNLEKLLESSRENQRIKTNGQRGLFEGMNFNNNIKMEAATPASEKEKLGWEKELLGLFISSHPLNNFKNILESKTTAIANISKNNQGRNARVRIGGIISKVKKIITKSGRPMLFVSVEDLNEKLEVVVFPSIMEGNSEIFQENKIVMVSGRMDSKDGVPKLICEEVEEIIES
jgi:DNA polymerase-3 subunit alpha